MTGSSRPTDSRRRRSGTVGWSDRLRPHRVPTLVILAAVLLANAPALLHQVTANPLNIDAYLGPGATSRLPGFPFIDPNAGYTTQALGHLVALDWLHGHVPWWNPFEGIGSPLAGEMQSGAFFPLTMLLAFHDGLLFLQISLELLTGWSTYALVHRLGVGRTFSTAAGVAFGLCGTYAWLAHAPIRPVALLPLSLLGVEQALDAATEDRRGGWCLLAVAIGLSILAGFPETSAIDGALVGLWGILRMVGPGRRCWWPMIRKLVAGGVAGVALAAPLLVAFFTYAPYANLGPHNGNGLAYAALSTGGLPQVILPYGLGPIFGLHATAGHPDVISIQWNNVGGYLGATLIAAGLVGLIGRRNRWLRVGLGAWISLCLLRTYGFPPVLHLMALVPGLRSVAFYRYSNPSWELALVVLAALGLDDVARNRVRRWAVVAGAGIAGVTALWATATLWPLLTDAVPASPVRGPQPHDYAVGSLAGALVVLTALAVGGVWAGHRPKGPRFERLRRRGRVLAAAAVMVEAVALLAFPYLSAPPPSPLATGSVAWLQAHLGTYRFYSLGPIQPNYGSYFGIGQIDTNDLPRPKSYDDEIATRLDPNTPSGGFTGSNVASTTGPTPAQELNEHLANYEQLGTRFVVETAGGTDIEGRPFPAPGSPPWPSGPRRVYRDRFAEIWQLPAPAPAFSATPVGAGSAARTGTGSIGVTCTLVVHGWDAARVTCPRPSVLTRQVQYIPGWTATVDGTVVPVAHAVAGPPGLFQQVRVPAGTSTVRFTFVPPYTGLALASSLVAAVAIVGSLAMGRRRRRRPGGAPRRTGPRR